MERTVPWIHLDTVDWDKSEEARMALPVGYAPSDEALNEILADYPEEFSADLPLHVLLANAWETSTD